mmetsp:Transcript_21604/g.27264  ORF Transcript_21604/g.27264 Transcript_21604/m.27264 type:complete len:170 (+) Transcript_21604:3-512(+)
MILSSYALYVEHKTQHLRGTAGSATTASTTPNFMEEKGEPFKALCDIEAIGASCSAVFNLPEGRLLSFFSIVPEGHILDVPNAFLGLLHYTSMILIESFIYCRYYTKPFVKSGTFVMTCLAMSSSIYLAWKLIMLRELCILCWTTHLLNSLLLYHYGKRLFGSVKNKAE